MSALEYLRRLHEEELYESVVYLGSVVSTTQERGEAASTEQRFEVATLLADAHFHLQQYKKAETVYMSGLNLRRALNRTPGASKKFLAEVELKHRLFLCLSRQGKNSEALGLLEGIPLPMRPPKIKAALANLHLRVGSRPKAAEYFKDLVAETPYALASVVQLQALEAPAVQKTAAPFSPWWEGTRRLEGLSGSKWFPLWAAASERLGRRDWEGALSALRELEERTELASNALVLAGLGRAYFHSGQKQKAIGYLRRVAGGGGATELLASALYEAKATKDLEALSSRLLGESPRGPEAWLSLGFLCLAQRRHPEALNFAHKALAAPATAAPTGPQLEGLILKAKILSEMKNYPAAVAHYQEALQLDNYRVETYEGLVATYLEQKKIAEARKAGEVCVKTLGADKPRALILLAQVLAKDVDKVGKAVELAEKAVEAAPYLLNAVYFLAELYGQLGDNEAAVRILREQAEHYPSSKLHRMLGDFLSKVNRPSEAVDCYRFALSLDPSDHHALEGMEGAAEQSCGAGSPGTTPSSFSPFMPPPAPSKFTRRPPNSATSSSISVGASSSLAAFPSLDDAMEEEEEPVDLS